MARGRVQLPTFALGVVTLGVCTASHKIAYDEKSPIFIGVWSTLWLAVSCTGSHCFRAKVSQKYLTVRLPDRLRTYCPRVAGPKKEQSNAEKSYPHRRRF